MQIESPTTQINMYPSMTKQYDFEGKSKNKNDCKAKSKVLA
jgi:hypothetical protein